MQINDYDLENLFNRIIKLKHVIQNLAGLVQNPMDIDEDMIDEWTNMKEELIAELELIEREIRNKVH